MADWTVGPRAGRARFGRRVEPPQGIAAVLEGLLRILVLLGTVIALTALLAAIAPGAASRPADEERQAIDGTAFRLCADAPAPCVIDGDTVRLGGDVIRIADIDTPEVRGFACRGERVLADRATRRLLALLNQGPVDVHVHGRRDADVYARKLRVLARGGVSLGETLIAEGLAHRWDGMRHGWCG